MLSKIVWYIIDVPINSCRYARKKAAALLMHGNFSNVVDRRLDKQMNSRVNGVSINSFLLITSICFIP